MRGTDARTGKPTSGLAHLRQSIRDILTTPLGSRIMRRNYGSRLFDLVDNPLNETTLVEIFAATAEALQQWEPRLRITRVQARSINGVSTEGVSSSSTGSVAIDLEAIFLPTGQPVFLDGIVLK
jgi:phage baseplate assembly protein W